MDLSTLIALTWVALIAAAALTGLAKTAVPGLASVTASLFALVLPAKKSTGVNARPAPHRGRDRPVGVSARRECGGPETPRAVNARRRVPRSAPSGGERPDTDAASDRRDPPTYRARLIPMSRSIIKGLRHSTPSAAHASGILIRLFDLGADFSCVTTTHPLASACATIQESATR